MNTGDLLRWWKRFAEHGAGTVRQAYERALHECSRVEAVARLLTPREVTRTPLGRAVAASSASHQSPDAIVQIAQAVALRGFPCVFLPSSSIRSHARSRAAAESILPLYSAHRARTREDFSNSLNAAATRAALYFSG